MNCKKMGKPVIRNATNTVFYDIDIGRTSTHILVNRQDSKFVTLHWFVRERNVATHPRCRHPILSAVVYVLQVQLIPIVISLNQRSISYHHLYVCERSVCVFRSIRTFMIWARYQQLSSLKRAMQISPRHHSSIGGISTSLLL